MSELELEPRQESPRQSAPTIKLFPFEPLQSLPRQSSPTSNLFLPADTFFLHPAPDSQLAPSKNASSSDFRTPIIPLFTQTIGSFSSSVCHQSIFHLPFSILHPRRSILANQQLMSPVKMTDTTGAKRKRGLGSPEKGNCIGPGIPPKRGRASVEPASQDGESAIIKAEPDLDVASESETQPGSKPANEEQDLEKPEEQEDEKPEEQDDEEPNEQVDEKPDEQVEMVKRSPSASPPPVKEEEEDKQCSLEQNVDPVCATSLPSETTSTKTSVEREAPVGKTPVGTPVGRAPVDRRPRVLVTPIVTRTSPLGRRVPASTPLRESTLRRRPHPMPTMVQRRRRSPVRPSARHARWPVRTPGVGCHRAPAYTPCSQAPRLPARCAPCRTNASRRYLGRLRTACSPARDASWPVPSTCSPVRTTCDPPGPAPVPDPPAPAPTPAPRPRWFGKSAPPALEAGSRPHPHGNNWGAAPQPSPRAPPVAPATSPGRPTPRDRQPVHRDVQGAHKALRPCGRTAARSRPDGA